MNINFEILIASRYLSSRRSESFISISSLFSFIGITIGVATLIIVMSVMNGFRLELVDKIVGVNGHAIAYLNEKKNSKKINDLVDRIENLEEVEFVSKELEIHAMISNKNNSSGIIIKGIDKVDLLERPSIANNIINGDISGFTNYSLIIGSRLASFLNVQIGDSINILTASSIASPFGSFPTSDSFQIAGIFDIGMYDYDRNIIFMPRNIATFIDSANRNASQLEIFLSKNNNLRKVSLEIQSILNQQGKVYSWEKIHRELFNALKIEKKVMFFILLLIVFIAAFNLISSIIMIVKDKERGIGILRSLGANKNEILRIFILIGSFVGFFGTLIGAILGILISLNLASIQLFLESMFSSKLFSPEIYFFNIIPSSINFSEVFIIIFISIIMSILSTIYPAWKATKVQPANILRYE
tara:strand:+ start:2794 stop:4038 length:1245 start_codon:yes stop_codon:yes gene_type:complete